MSNRTAVSAWTGGAPTSAPHSPPPSRTAARQARKRNERQATDEKIPPHSVEAERALLSSLIDQHDGAKARAEAAAKITVDHFYVPKHRTVFAALCAMDEEHSPVDLVTTTEFLRNNGDLDAIGGPGAVADFIGYVPSGALVGHYIEIVRNKYILREVRRAAEITIQRTNGAPQDEPDSILAELEAHVASIRSLGDDGQKPGVSIIDLAEKNPQDFEKDNLLGNRFLCVLGGMIFVGASGIGKSSASVQMDIAWSLGREAFGIRPARPLKILCINAENDDGDLSEMARGVCDHLQLSDAEREVVRRNVIYVSERAATGPELLCRLRALVRQYRPDIIRLDVLHAFAGGDVRDPRVTTLFLRNGLNPILEEFRCAAIINHHTPKTTYRDTSNWTATDWMYAGAGNADITNWARAILIIDATHVHNAFTFRAAKRGSRIGWVDEDGHCVYDRLFCWHSGGSIFWRDATEEDMQRVALAKSGKPLKTKEDLKALIPLDEEIPKLALIERARLNGIGQNRARSLLSELIADKELFEWHIPRKGTNPEVKIARREQTLI